MKLTRNRLKELIRQSIKEIDFEDEEAFKKYQSQHKMRPSTKVNISGKDTTVGQASGEKGGGEKSGPDLSKLDSKQLDSLDDKMYEKEQKAGDRGVGLNNHLDSLMDTRHSSFRTEPEVHKERIKKLSAEIDQNFEEQEKIMNQRSEIRKAMIQKMEMGESVNESVHESIKKPRKTTVKEVKKWFKTLEENRYKKTYGSDARRVSWMVNNNLSEDYEAMPTSMQKKWPKAAYKRERFLAKEFVKHLKGETKLREAIRKIVGGLIDEQKLTEATIWFNPKVLEPYLKKIGLKFPKYPKQGDVTKDGKVVGYMSNFNGFMVYSKSLLKQLQKVESKYKLGIWNPTSDLTMEGKLTEAKKIPYNEKDWKKYQKMFEKLSGNKSLMVIDKRGKEYSWEDGSKYGVVVMDRQDRTDSLKHKEIERLEIR